MPNYCSNTLVVEATDTQDLNKFVSEVRLEEDKTIVPFSLKKLYPMPESLSIEESSTGNNAYALLFGSDNDKLKALHLSGADEANYKNELEKRIEKLSEAEKELAKQIKYNKEHHGARSWYEWCVENWGTKWDVDSSITDQSDTSISYNFDSAWSPPVNAIIEGSKKYPNLKFDLSYYEDGMDFLGYHVIQNGEILESDEASLSSRTSKDITLIEIQEDTEEKGVVCIHFQVEAFVDPYDMKDNEKTTGSLTVKINSAMDLYGFEALEENEIWQESFMLGAESPEFDTDFDDDYAFGTNLETVLTSPEVKAALQDWITAQIQPNAPVVPVETVSRAKRKI